MRRCEEQHRVLRELLSACVRRLAACNPRQPPAAKLLLRHNYAHKLGVAATAAAAAGLERAAKWSHLPSSPFGPNVAAVPRYETMRAERATTTQPASQRLIWSSRKSSLREHRNAGVLRARSQSNSATITFVLGASAPLVFRACGAAKCACLWLIKFVWNARENSARTKYIRLFCRCI